MPSIYNPHRTATLVEQTTARSKAMEIAVKLRASAMFDQGIALPEAIRTVVPQILEKEYLALGIDRQEWDVRAGISRRIVDQGRCLGICGSNIFDVSRLTKLFAKTDVEDVVLDDIRLPYDAIYVHFGDSPELDVSATTGVPGTHIEGAYVATSLDPQAENARFYVVSFVCSVPDYDRISTMTFGESLRRQTRAAFGVFWAGKTVAESLQEHEGYDGDPAVHDAKPQIDAALRMLVNSLCYISMPKADIVVEWPADAPEAWIRGSERPNQGDAAKYRDRLKLRGFHKVRICGRSYERILGDLQAGMRDGVEPHWRRGHWRRQRYGTALAEMRRIWLLPTVVNMHLDLPARGRVYDVQPEALAG